MNKIIENIKEVSPTESEVTFLTPETGERKVIILPDYCIRKLVGEEEFFVVGEEVTD